MTKNFRETLKQEMNNPKFKKEWDALEPEYQLVKAILDNRKAQGLTQKKLAAITGINQADISRFEQGVGNPSLATLKKLAKGLKMNLKIEFVPVSR